LTFYEFINIDGVKNMILAAKKNGVGYFLHISAAGVTGSLGSIPANENTVCHPYTKYEKTKYEGECLALSLSSKVGLPLGLEKKVVTVENEVLYNTKFADNAFDLSYNFVIWTELSDPFRYLQEMKRISGKYVLLVTCNNFQPGYPWHRFLHWLYGFPWTHGQVRYNHITTVKKLFKTSGLDVIEYGTIDTPCWPDHTGPRDVRLHRRFGSKNEEPPKTRPHWEVPFLEYVRTGNYPVWMKLLGRWDMLFRKGVFKLPMSHLFYVLGRKM
jgi:hypothetical protein